MIDRISTTVLYEGYLLYPYRASAVKNQQRFNFGVLVPRAYGDSQTGSESSWMQTECLITGNEAVVRVQVRFLHLQHRQIERSVKAASTQGERISDSVAFQAVNSLEYNGERYQTWSEAIERQFTSPQTPLADLLQTSSVLHFEFGPETFDEQIGGEQEYPVGRIVRSIQRIKGRLELSASQVADRLCRLRIQVANETDAPIEAMCIREQALDYSLVSAHAVLQVECGSFVSLLEPQAEFTAAASACQQKGCWPVLVGPPGDRSTMLGSPIILYDYPEVAAESPGDFFDGTEMDEMLMLRVMTMTEEEHREMHGLDERARGLLERTTLIAHDDWRKLHGTIRDLRINALNSGTAPLEASVTQ